MINFNNIIYSKPQQQKQQNVSLKIGDPLLEVGLMQTKRKSSRFGEMSFCVYPVFVGQGWIRLRLLVFIPIAKHVFHPELWQNTRLSANMESTTKSLCTIKSSSRTPKCQVLCWWSGVGLFDMPHGVGSLVVGFGKLGLTPS